MSLNWNDTKSRGLLFSKTWTDSCKEHSSKQRSTIEQAAQCVLEARAQFASSSLAELYNPPTMPPTLLKAHQKLGTAVDAAYQPSGGKKSYAFNAESRRIEASVLLAAIAVIHLTNSYAAAHESNSQHS
jgi:hypothetical protein